MGQLLSVSNPKTLKSLSQGYLTVGFSESENVRW
jgi:hypothetical protein